MDVDTIQTVEQRVLCSLRKIIRAVDIYSRRLNSEFGLTTPQLICLKAVTNTQTCMTFSMLTKEVNLSPSTVTGIVDRLESKGFLKRQRSNEDRRKVFILPTSMGKEIVAKSPSLLQDRLSLSLDKLPQNEQQQIIESLERVVLMMGIEDVEASPNLISNTIVGI